VLRHFEGRVELEFVDRELRKVDSDRDGTVLAVESLAVARPADNRSHWIIFP
jgi:hypothetical protein